MQFHPFDNGIPRHDTIARARCRLNLEQVHNSFMSWIQGIVQEVDGDTVAIDGKGARGSFNTRERRNALHMLSAWSCSYSGFWGNRKWVVNQMKLPLSLLSLLDISRRIVTIDAMGCQQKIAKNDYCPKSRLRAGSQRQSFWVTPGAGSMAP